eukprot:gene285-158_t
MKCVREVSEGDACSLSVTNNQRPGGEGGGGTETKRVPSAPPTEQRWQVSTLIEPAINK